MLEQLYFRLLVICLAATAFVTKEVRAQDLSQDLLLHYEFNGNALDDSGNGHHAIPSNVTDENDRFAAPVESYQFSGTNSHVETPASPNLRPNFPFSIAYWIKPISGQSSVYNIFTPDHNIGFYYGPTTAFVAPTNRISFVYGDGGIVSSTNRRSFICDDQVNPDEWNLAVGVYNSSNNVEIYINGCPCSQYSTSGSGGPLTYGGNTGKISEGHLSTSPYFEGVLDDIYFWSRALTQLDVDVLNDYHPGIPEFTLGNDTTICDGESIDLELPGDFSNIQWSTGQSGNTISVSTPGLVWASGEDINCGIHRDTIIIDFFGPAQSTVNFDLCDGDTLLILGNVFIGAGTFPTILPNASFQGCDSTVFVEITSLNPSFGQLDTIVCDGTSLVYLDSVFSNAGTHFYTFENMAENGCDSIVEINLMFYPMAVSLLDSQICIDDSILVNGNYYHQSNPLGSETIIAGSSQDCDSTINISLTFFPLAEEIFQATFCSGDSIIINGQIYNEANPIGIEIIAGGSVMGCDSIINVALSFYPEAVGNFNLTLCTGDSVIINGQTYNEVNSVGIEIIAGASSMGCDSIINVNILFDNSVQSNLFLQLCPGDSIIVNGMIYNQNNPIGTETIPMGSAGGCDSSINIALIFSNIALGNFQSTLCVGDSILVNGQIYNETNPSGVEIIVGGSSAGCDSMVNVNIQFESSITNDLLMELCPGDSIIVNGTVYNELNNSGMELISMGSVAGCDSIVNVLLIFLLEATGDFQSTLCAGDSILINGQIYNETNPSGVERIVGGSSTGCDSMINVKIQFESSITNDLFMQLCLGDSIIVNGTVYNEQNNAGMELIPMGSAAGCDSIVNVLLTFFLEATGDFQSTLCAGDSILINGQIYNETNLTGVEIIVGGSSTGCDSMIDVTIQFESSITNDLFMELCLGDSIFVNGTVYNEQNNAGMELIPMGSVAGCDSIINVLLTFFPEATGTFQSMLCVGDSILINGQIYNEINPSGIELIVGGSSSGCDSMVNVSIQFESSITNDLFMELCLDDSIIVNGIVYNELNNSGMELIPMGSVAGCDSIVNVSLTFFPESTGTFETTLCTGDSVQVNGQIYNESNPIGIEVIENGGTAGCDSTVNVNIQFINSVEHDLFLILCDGDSVVVNGTVYNQINNIGSELFPGASMAGCDSMVNIQLTYENEIVVNLFDTIVNGEPILFNGVSYSAQGSFVAFEGFSLQGCDSIVILNLIEIFDNSDVYIPNAFSPNNDGINDNFGVYSKHDLTIVKLDIYNRWGGKVFSHDGDFDSLNQNSLWDGTAGGKNCQEGVYVYVMTIRQGTSERFLSGEILIVR